MQAFWVEGLYLSSRAAQRARKKGSYPAADIEPYAKVIWAENYEAAKRLAAEDLAGGEWVEGPAVTLQTEEKRMRAMGMPELPGFESPKKRRK